MRYETAYGIAVTAIADAVTRGYRFQPDAVPMVTWAIQSSRSIDEAKQSASMMMEAVRISLNPRWDGSIA